MAVDSSIGPENAANERQRNRRDARERKSKRNQNEMIIKLKNSHIVQFNCVEIFSASSSISIHRATDDRHCAVFDPRRSQFVFFSILLLP